MAEIVTCRVNGCEETLAAGTTVSELLALHKVNAGAVVVEVNLNIVNRVDYLSMVLAAGDTVEILRFVGGG